MVMKALGDGAAALSNVKELVSIAASIDEKRLKILDSLVTRVINLAATKGVTAPDPRTLEIVLEILKAFATCPVENLQEANAFADKILKIIKTTPPEMMALGKELGAALTEKK
jgi:hypothetical protein